MTVVTLEMNFSEMMATRNPDQTKITPLAGRTLFSVDNWVQRKLLGATRMKGPHLGPILQIFQAKFLIYKIAS